MVKTEADDATECSRDDQPTTGVFGFLMCGVLCISPNLPIVVE